MGNTTAPLVFLFLATAAASSSAAPPTYRVEDLGLLAGTAESTATSINRGGAVVGQARPAGGFFQGVLWPENTTTPTELATLVGESVSVANGINDAGHLTSVAGFAVAGQSTGGTAHVWNGSQWIDIGKLGLGTPLATLSSVGNAINNRDQVVGRAWASDGATGFFHAFHWESGRISDLGTISPCKESTALDVNDSGEIAGSTTTECLPSIAVLWQDADQAPVAINDLLTSAGISENVVQATGINDSGVVLTQRVANGRGRCAIFRRQPVPAIVDIGAIGPDAQFFTTCVPGKINNHGAVVATQIGSASIALLYEGNVLYDVNDLLETASSATWELLTATDINDSGTIVGQGRIGGELHAYRAFRIGSPLACPGDCDGSRSVSVDEIVTLVNIALGTQPATNCTAGDSDSDQRVTVDEIIAAIGSALNGCPN